MTGDIIPLDEAKRHGAAASKRAARGPSEPGKDQEFELRLAMLPRNDLGNAQRFIERRGADFFWVKDAGWYGWDGKRWDFGSGEVAAKLAAQDVATAMRHEAHAIEQGGQVADETEKQFEERVGAAYKWATASGNATRLAAMLDTAAPQLARDQTDLDADHFLFNVDNGTLVLGQRDADGNVTVEFRAHERADLITRLAPAVYDAAATTAPNWHAFLDLFQPDPEIQAFLQRFYGYGLTGSIEEQVVLLNHGEGMNGKSTMIDLLTWLIGDYAMTLPIQSLLANDRKGGSEASPDLARLPGARLVRSSEPKKGAVFDESLLKHLTGGEPISVRHLNKGFFDFLPTFKLVLSFNRRPIIRGDDDGTWRRLPMVKFDVQIPTASADRRFIDKLRPEASAILNWMLDGYRLWRDMGLAMPDKVRAATAEYRAESDRVGNFLTAVCEITGAATDALPSSDLYACYALWCEKNALDPINQTAFGRSMSERRGITKTRSGTVTYYGIQVKDLGLLSEAKDVVRKRSPARGVGDE